MKVRAAVAHKAGAPLAIETVDLEGPRGGEVLVEIKATGDLPHRRVHALGRRSGGPVPGDPRPRGRGRRRRGRARRDDAEEGRSRHPALHAGMPAVQVVPVAQDQPLHGDPRDAGQGRDARRHQPLLARRQAAPPLHGLLDVRELHRAAGDRAREDPRGRAVRQGLLHRLRRDHRHRRGHQHRQGRGRRQRRRVRPRRHRAQRRPGRAHGRRQHDRRRRPQPGARGAGREVRHDALREPEGSRGRSRRRTSSSSPTAAPTTASSASATST